MNGQFSATSAFHRPGSRQASFAQQDPLTLVPWAGGHRVLWLNCPLGDSSQPRAQVISGLRRGGAVVQGICGLLGPCSI